MAFFLTEKTESPTVRRLEESRRQGLVARSSEVTAVAVVSAALLTVQSQREPALNAIAGQFNYYFTTALGPEREVLLHATGVRSVEWLAMLLLPVLSAVTVAALAAQLAQTGLNLTPKSLAPDFSRISLAAGFQRLFSPLALGEGCKAVLKLTTLSWVVWSALRAHWPQLVMTARMDVLSGLTVAAAVTRTLAGRLVFALVVLAAADYAMQRMRMLAKLRMTRQEVKEETRMTEGDPTVRARIRRRQRQIAMQRTLQQVPKADVLVVNPTHVAVALKYEPGGTAAPRVLAKGAELLAQRMIAVARQHNVMVVQNVTLARALFHHVEVGRAIPAELYQAVAEVLAYVYRVTGRARNFARREARSAPGVR